MILSPGHEISKYFVEDVVGEGGMAIVYRVRHQQLGSVYALKVLSTPSVAVRDRMLKEGRIQAKLRHPNIVSVMDVLDVNGMTGLLMEYVRGPSLEALLAEVAIPLDEALSLFGGILAGVDAAHEKGLIHRDLKPANVLLQPTDEGVYPKVTDFGIAKEVAQSSSATRTGVTMGTPSYIAPEQVEDAANVDKRADIFSLGTILYELVCGVKAFDGRNALRILNAVMKGRYTPPEAHRPDLPANVIAAINGALAKKPEDRIGSCAELAALLTGSESGGTVSELFPRFLPHATASAQTVSRMAFATPPGALNRYKTPSTAQSTLSESDILGFGVDPTVGANEGSRTLNPQILVMPFERAPLLAPALILAMGTALGSLWSLATLPTPGAGMRAALSAQPLEAGLELPPSLIGQSYPVVVRSGVAESAVQDEADRVGGAGNGFSKLVDRLGKDGNRTSDSPWDDPNAQLGRGSVLSPTPASPPPEGGTGGLFGRKGPRPARFKLGAEQDATKVMLTDGVQYWEYGRVPAGTYDVLAWFGTPESLRAGSVTLGEGERVTIRCAYNRGACTVVSD